MKKLVILTLLAASALVGGLYFHFRDGGGLSLKVVPVGKGDITSTLSATGKVVSREEAAVGASIAARVKAVYVNEGERVAQGTLLALLEDRELLEMVQKAKESAREAHEKVRRLVRNHDSLVAVYAAGGISRQSLDDAASDLEMARAGTGRATAELNAARATLDKLKIRAPFSGIITRKEINPGEWAAPGVSLFSMAKQSRREIEVMIDESDSGLVKHGQDVELTSDAFPGYAWKESVTEVSSAVRKEGAANSIKVRVSFGTKAPALKLGQQVDAKISTAHHADIVRLPFETLITTGGKNSVAVVRDGKICFVPVVTGVEDAVYVEIEKGVSAGEEVILPEGKVLKEGEPVKSVTRELPRQ